MAGKIFLSYRREDTAGFALALFARLEQSFSAESLFMDVEGGIGAGQDFVRVIEEQVGACDAMLVLIGPDWLTVKDEAGHRRLDNPEDFVRIEVGSALRFGRRVIPVLVQRTEMPRADVLPQPLKALTRCNAVGLTAERFKADAQGLIKALERALAEVQEAKHKSETETAAAEKLRAAEEAAKAEAAARAVRNAAIEGLSPGLIDKAEELASWDFIKASERLEDFRDHLARFPQGVSERWARARLESLVWTRLPRPVDMDALNDFLAEFPNGANASEANAKLAELETQGAPANTAEGREKRNMDAGASASAAGSKSSFSERLAHSLFSLNKVEGTGAALGDESIRTFRHADWVWALAFSPEGRTALSGSYDRTLKLWDVATGKEVRTFAGHTSMVWSVAFSPDGRTALSGSHDETLKLWDVATGSEIRTFAGHTKTVSSVAFFPDGQSALSGSDDHTLKLWGLATGKEIRTFAGHTGAVNSAALSPDGRIVLSGSDDHTLKLWDPATGKEVRTFAGHRYQVRSVAFSPDARSGLSGSYDKTVKLWNLATGEEIRTFAGHGDGVCSVAFSPDARSGLSGSYDKTVKLWNIRTGRVERTFVGHTGPVRCVVFAPDGRSALSGSHDGTLKLWDLTRDQ
jgi:WD40 repeat protein